MEIPTHPDMETLYKHVGKGKTHLMQAMMDHRGGGGLTNAFKAVGKAVGKFAKSAGKAAWKGIVTASKFVGKHHKAILNTTGTVTDLVSGLGGQLGLFDEDTQDTLDYIAHRAKALGSTTKKETKESTSETKRGKGQLRGYISY